MDQIDTRGMSCPQPVLMTKKAISNHPKKLEILVDNNTAKNNVSRFLEHTGYTFQIKEVDEDFVICAKK